MGCLKTLINVRGCSQDVQPFVYLNSLQGITIKSLDSISNEDRITYVATLEAIIERAYRRMINDLAINAGIQLNSFQETYCIGRLNDPLEFVPASGAILQGIQFKFQASKYLSLYIGSLFFYSNVVQTLNFYVYDNVSGQILDTITADLVVGENNIVVNKSYFPGRYSQRVMIVYNSADSGYYKSTAEACHDACCTCEGLPCASTGCFWGSGVANLATTHETYGLGVEYALECSWERLICSNARLFSQAILYAAGVEYIYELESSYRFNQYTSTKKEENQERKKLFEKRYLQELKAAIQGLNFQDNCCFECKGTGIMYKFAMP